MMRTLILAMVVLLLPGFALAQQLPTIYTGTALIDDQPANASVEVKDSSGNLLRSATPDDTGGYWLTVNWDDPYTEGDEGVSSGESITFYIDGMEAASRTVDPAGSYNYLNLSVVEEEEEAPAVGAAVGGVYSPEVTVLANSIDLGLAEEFVDHLEAQGIDVTLTTAKNFSDYNQKEYVVILGGHRAYEGVGEIAGNILTEEEKAEILEGSAFLKKKSLFRTGGITYIFAGMDRDATAEAWKEGDRYKEIAGDIKYNRG